MLDLIRRKRDFFAGGLMMLIGLGAAVAGGTDQVGTLQKMGPGFFPLALGILLTLLGVAIAGTAAGGTETAEKTAMEGESAIPARAEWRGWLCIVAGPVLFILFGHYGGLAPATFACVFVAALGDREATVKSSLILAAGITVLGIVLFAYILGVPFPVWQWGAS